MECTHDVLHQYQPRGTGSKSTNILDGSPEAQSKEKKGKIDAVDMTWTY
jgi:hypothetical protein